MDITKIEPEAALFAYRARHRESKKWLEQFVSWMPPEAALVLDVGSGTGTLALQLAERASFVVGVDASPTMIGLARKNEAESGKTNVAWVIASADALPFAGATFDYITSTFALRFSNPHLSLPEIRRTIRPGGRVAIRDVVTKASPFGFWIDHLRRTMHLMPKLLRHAGWVEMWRLVGSQLTHEGVQHARRSRGLSPATFMEIFQHYFPEEDNRFIFSPGKLFWENHPDCRDADRSTREKITSDHA